MARCHKHSAHFDYGVLHSQQFASIQKLTTPHCCNTAYTSNMAAVTRVSVTLGIKTSAINVNNVASNAPLMDNLCSRCASTASVAGVDDVTKLRGNVLAIY